MVRRVNEGHIYTGRGKSFALLRMLEVKLDYRDGLVDFVYDPKRVNPYAKCKQGWCLDDGYGVTHCP
jgi:hypothetical protein